MSKIPNHKFTKNNRKSSKQNKYIFIELDSHSLSHLYYDIVSADSSFLNNAATKIFPYLYNSSRLKNKKYNTSVNGNGYFISPLDKSKRYNPWKSWNKSEGNKQTKKRVMESQNIDNFHCDEREIQ